MKKSFFAALFTLVIFTAEAQTQKWAIGVEVGEPVAVSIRKYGDRNALDLSFGTYSGLFKSKKTYKNSKDEFASIGFMFNGSYLWYAPFFNERMSAYGGVGVQINSRRYYPDKNFKSIRTNNISTGPSLTGGLEFFFAAKPTSIFVEGGAYVELLPKIFYLNPNLSVGVRHNF